MKRGRVAEKMRNIDVSRRGRQKVSSAASSPGCSVLMVVSGIVTSGEI
jgi:hypothetical protein